MSTLQTIGEQLRQYRTQQKLFKNALAQRSRVNRNVVGQLEAGTGNVELNTLIALCEELGLDIMLVPKEVSAMAAQSGMPEMSPRRLERERILREAMQGADK